MYAEIYAESSDAIRTGKTMRVRARLGSESFVVSERAPPTSLSIATGSKERVSPVVEGEQRFVSRRLRVQLDKEEVEALVTAALNGRILTTASIKSLAGVNRVKQLEAKLAKLQAQVAALKASSSALTKAARSIKRLVRDA